MKERWKRHTILALILAAQLPVFAAPTPARAQESGSSQQTLERLAALPEAEAIPEAAPIAYGADPLQRLDLWRASGALPAPLVVFVHGGGWTRGDKDTATGDTKVAHFLGLGYAFASIDYRLVPVATVEDQAQDVAQALAWLRGHAAAYGIDPGRIVLMGHSAGAQLVALVGTDPHYLAASGLDESVLRGVVALDGACYDVPRQIAEGGPFMHATYIEAFGSDPTRQRRLSPVFQTAPPNAPAFLLLHVARPDSTAQAEELARSLTAAGTPVDIQGFPGIGLRGHMEINRALGDPAYPATPILDAWLARVLAPRP